ncbi:unnamed protein product [Cyprideis torosa]|uniref:poly(ADP-ribose) glycohydrolase n=1 Tax=Cyprideis torosa TaxID=163714 RepID=A0A7R8ZLY9_9CRUS|nr:unnamed protein product [Cyprideis torosa]CAG0892968.1 unnamed protein product [Cyprideis torosa]
MPCSPRNLYPLPGDDDRTGSRWEMIQKALREPIRCIQDLEAAILSYNTRFSDQWDFAHLRYFLESEMVDEERDHFFKVTMLKMQRLALALPEVVTQAPPLLRARTNQSVTLSQKQIACLLCCAFFCLFPRRNSGKQFKDFPDINFNVLFCGENRRWAKRTSKAVRIQNDPAVPPPGRCRVAKFHCLLHYFRRVTDKVPPGVVTITRRCLPKTRLPDWSQMSSVQLSRDLHVDSAGLIEVQGEGLLQADFANRFLGGGVLRSGCVQEEIRFLLSPELIVGLLLCERMEDTEVVLLTGAEQYSYGTGYAETFKWIAPCYDTVPRDPFRRRMTQAFVAFFVRPSSEQPAVAVATGNWGCGAFNGDKELKFLLQLLAASANSQRGMAYFTFGDEDFRDRIAHLHSVLLASGFSVGDMYAILTRFSPSSEAMSVFDHLLHSIGAEGTQNRSKAKNCASDVTSVGSPVVSRVPRVSKDQVARAVASVGPPVMSRDEDRKPLSRVSKDQVARAVASAGPPRTVGIPVEKGSSEELALKDEAMMSLLLEREEEEVMEWEGEEGSHEERASTRLSLLEALEQAEEEAK